jgi:hypothetical protein|tara:strand:- start:11133 stop:11423 length:291 start_codon:yes stop_codon:yes gene_type:complete
MTLKTEDKSFGSPDDAFYLAELWTKKSGEVIGKELGLTPKQIRKKNLLLKVTKELGSKTHLTHSTLQRDIRILREFKKTPLLDMKMKELKHRLKKY